MILKMDSEQEIINNGLERDLVRLKKASMESADDMSPFVQDR